jgi:purine-binding chemotaxis protein CheW
VGVIGLKVDEVRRIITVASDAMLPPPQLTRGIRGELLIAVVPQEDEIYMLMDIENVLTSEEKQELKEADLEPAAGEGVA